MIGFNINYLEKKPTTTAAEAKTILDMQFNGCCIWHERKSHSIPINFLIKSLELDSKPSCAREYNIVQALWKCSRIRNEISTDNWTWNVSMGHCSMNDSRWVWEYLCVCARAVRWNSVVHPATSSIAIWELCNIHEHSSWMLMGSRLTAAAAWSPQGYILCYFMMLCPSFISIC